LDECNKNSVCVISGEFVDGEKATVVVRLRANPKPYLYSWTAEGNDLDRQRFNQMDAGKVKLMGVSISTRV
jgi:hypothetical protein